LENAIGKLIKTGNKKRISETMNPFIPPEEFHQSRINESNKEIA
jgi:hypothetical protein